MSVLLQGRTVAVSGPHAPGEPRVAVSLVWAVLLMPDPFLSNDSAQETVPQGSDFPHLSLWLLGLEPVPFPKCLLVLVAFYGTSWKNETGGGRRLYLQTSPSLTFSYGNSNPLHTL